MTNSLFKTNVPANSSLSLLFYHSNAQNYKPAKACGSVACMMASEG